jgi:DNA topoisomerase III
VPTGQLHRRPGPGAQATSPGLGSGRYRGKAASTYRTPRRRLDCRDGPGEARTVNGVTRLVICEKPSVAADIAAALGGGFTRTPWGHASRDVLVAAAAGHLVAELPPEGYDQKYKKWDFADLPIVPDTFRYTVRDKRAGERMRDLAELIQREDVTEIVNACDAGREGELIFKLILQYARLPQPKTVLRAWFSSMTPEAICAAFDDLRPDHEMAGLEAAARARSEADWVVGMNATRAATLTLGGTRQLLSLGRVQTPTLALVVRRDVEIDDFVSVPYYTVEGAFGAPGGGYVGSWRSGREGDARDRFDSQADADDVKTRVQACGVAQVADVEVKPESISAPRLFDLTDLQREANRRYGMTAARTLAAAQSCYETHKVLSYPRTDSRYLPGDMAAVVPNLVARVRAADADYHTASDAVLAACDASRLVNDAKVTDHHALVPTDAPHNLAALSIEERRVYDLVARRLLAALLPPQQLERTVVWTVAATTGGPEWFRSSGRRDIAPGWRIAWPEGSWGEKEEPEEEGGDDDQQLPHLSTGEEVQVTGVRVTERHTKPPARYNEAALLGVMATAGRLVDDDDLAEALRERGLGTPATRASIIERLIKVEYLERQGRQLRCTDKGRGLILALGEHPLTLPELTGGWERQLRVIEGSDSGTVPGLRRDFDAAVRAFATEVVAGLDGATPAQLLAGRRKLAACPMPGCVGDVVTGRRGWGCTTYVSRDEPGCGFVVWKEQGGKKVTEAALLKKIEAIRSGKEPPPPPPTPRVVIGACPNDGCDGEIVARPKSWGCTSWRSPKQTGCGYVLWKTNPDGTELDETGARAHLAAGTMNAREVVVFAACPRCDGEVIDRGNVLGCNSWKSKRSPGCGTTVWRTTRDGRRLTDDEVKDALAAMVGTEAPKRTTRKRKP